MLGTSALADFRSGQAYSRSYTMHPDVPKSVAAPAAGIPAAAAKNRTRAASPPAIPDSGSTRAPRVYSSENDSHHPNSFASYPITQKSSLTPTPVFGSDTKCKSIVAESAEQQLQESLELRLTSLIIDTLDKSVPRLVEEFEKLNSVTKTRTGLHALAARVVHDHLINILDDYLAGIKTATRSEPHRSVTIPSHSSGAPADLVMPAQAITAEVTMDAESTIMTVPSMLVARLKDFDFTVGEHGFPAWRVWLEGMKISPAVLDAIAQRAANLDSVWSAITGNPLENIRPALKSICWAGILADLETAIGTKPRFSPVDEAQLKRLASAGRTAERDLASAVLRLNDICSAFISEYGYVRVVAIHRELTGKYGMASPYAERVATAYGSAWTLREQPGSPDLQRSFAAQLKEDICSSHFAETLARITEQSGNGATCQMLMRRQHEMLHQYCESVLGRSMPTQESM